MTTDHRALCAELLEALEIQLDELASTNRLCKRARAALAQPEPAVPSDEELDDLAAQMAIDHRDDQAPYAAAFARAVLARWGTTPTPVAVAERLPGAGDCDAKGRVWIFDEGDAITDPSWNLDNKARLEELKQMEVQGKLIGLCERWNIVWLPVHALPLPAAPEAGNG